MEGFAFEGNHFVEKAFSDNSNNSEIDYSSSNNKAANFDLSTGSGGE